MSRPGDLSRRAGLAGGLGLMVACAVLPWSALAEEGEALRAALRAAIGEAVPEEGGIELRVPAVAENGGQVPVAVLVDTPQTAAAHATAIHIFATRNPTPGVASFRLTPLLARAEVQTRIRLAEAQRIVVLATMNDGRVRRVTAEIRVTLGGCLS